MSRSGAHYSNFFSTAPFNPFLVTSSPPAPEAGVLLFIRVWWPIPPMRQIRCVRDSTEMLNAIRLFPSRDSWTSGLTETKGLTSVSLLVSFLIQAGLSQ